MNSASNPSPQLDPFKPLDTTRIPPLSSDQTLSPLYRAAISDTLNKKYAAYLNDRCFEVFCWQKSETLYVTILLSNHTESYYYPVETRIHLGTTTSAQDLAYLLCDYIDLYWHSYFAENEEVYLPIEWAQVTYQNHVLDIKAQLLNKALENSANTLLNQASAPHHDT